MNKTRDFSKKYAILLAVLLVAVIGELIWFGNKKTGYYIDEIYMYGTANSEYLPFLHLRNEGYQVKDWMLEYGPGENLLQFAGNIGKDISLLSKAGWHIKETPIYRDYLIAKATSNDWYTPGWVTGDYFRDYLAVSKNNRFNYFSVFYNFRGDNHPPLYGMLLHTVCSFFPEIHSKWFGLSLNMVIMVITILLLYKTVRDYLGGRMVAILAVTCYGLSAAAGDTAIYIRMYSLLTMMVVGSVYAHLRLRDSDWEWTKKDRRILVFFTVFGYLTQYYFLFFAFGIAVAAVVSMAVRKKKKSIIRYILTMVVSGVIGIIMWPFAFKAVFAGTRTGDTFGALFDLSDLLIRLRRMLDILTNHTLGVPGWVFPCLLLMIFAAFFSIRLIRREKGYNSVVEKAVLLATPFAVYFVLVSKVAPYLGDRYIMCLFPWCIVFVICGIYKILNYSISNLSLRTGLIIGLALLAAVSSNAFRLGNNYLYTDDAETENVENGVDCVYVLPPRWWNESYEDCTLLMKCKNVAVVRANELEMLRGTYNPDPDKDLLIIIRNGADEECADYILENFPVSDSSVSFSEKERYAAVHEKLVLRYDVK